VSSTAIRVSYLPTQCQPTFQCTLRSLQTKTRLHRVEDLTANHRCLSHALVLCAALYRDEKVVVAVHLSMSFIVLPLSLIEHLTRGRSHFVHSTRLSVGPLFLQGAIPMSLVAVPRAPARIPALSSEGAARRDMELTSSISLSRVPLSTANVTACVFHIS
jgi:hypothetical protein